MTIILVGQFVDILMGLVIDLCNFVFLQSNKIPYRNRKETTYMKYSHLCYPPLPHTSNYKLIYDNDHCCT